MNGQAKTCTISLRGLILYNSKGNSISEFHSSVHRTMSDTL
jgi:hypothetical protein